MTTTNVTITETPVTVTLQSNGGIPADHAASHESGGGDEIEIAQSQVTDLTSDLAGKVDDARVNALATHDTTAIDTFPRWVVTGGIVIAPGAMQAVRFRAPFDLTISKISYGCTTAQVGATLVRFGLYTWDGTTATLVARTASDTTIFATANTIYERALDTSDGYPSTYALTEGTEYLLAFVSVGHSTNPSPIGPPSQSSYNGVRSLAPQLAFAASGQTDLPASINLTSNASLFWGRVSA